MINFDCQRNAYNLLGNYAKLDKHSIVLEGYSGCGKSYIAKQYARLANIDDVVEVPAKVNDIKDSFINFLSLENKVLFIIENLDSGVPACSYVLLKFMEEPRNNMYIIVTCRDKNNIPDTILSRSMTASIGPATESDISKYKNFMYKDKTVSNYILDSCAKNFSDVDEIYNLTEEQVNYYSMWNNLKVFESAVNQISWKLGHYSDGKEITSNLLIKYLMSVNINNEHIFNSCRKCLDSLNDGKIARYLTLSKLAFDIKYCE